MIEDGNFVIDPVSKTIKLKNKSMTKFQIYSELREAFDGVAYWDYDIPVTTELIIKSTNGWKVEGL